MCVCVCVCVCNIMAEGFRFIYLVFGFGKAENLSAQCIGLLGANMSAGVYASGVDVSFRDKNPR